VSGAENPVWKVQTEEIDRVIPTRHFKSPEIGMRGRNRIQGDAAEFPSPGRPPISPLI